MPERAVSDDLGPATAPGAGKSWVGIAANPASGVGRGRRRVNHLIECLRALGISARVAWTLAERIQLVKDSGVDPDCLAIVAAGGDGTVAALINDRPGVPITVLPVGTENLFARHFQIRPEPAEVARLIARNQAVTIDLGEADDRRFALMAGFGFDAEVVTRHHRARLGGSGQPGPTHRAAYVLPVLRASWSYRFPALSVRIEDKGREETLVGTSVFVFNLPRYALGLAFAPSASEHDAKLDLIVFRNPGPFQALHYLWLVMRGIHLQRRGVTHRQVQKVSFSAVEPVPRQLDGDPAGRICEPGQPASMVRVLPAALRVLAPDGWLPGGRR